jgi:hypothetical protein
VPKVWGKAKADGYLEHIGQPVCLLRLRDLRHLQHVIGTRRDELSSLRATGAVLEEIDLG